MEVEKQYFELTHAQKRIWYMENIYSGYAFHNLSFLVRFQGLINEELLEKAINQFVAQHPAIRYRIREIDGDVRQYEESYKPFAVERINFEDSHDPPSAFTNWAHLAASQPFLLTEEPLYQFAIARLSERESGMYVKIHHIVGDGFSFQLIVDQLYSVYEQYVVSGNAKQIEIANYLDYIQQEKLYLDSGRFEKDRAFWLEQFTILPEWTAASSNHLEGRRLTFYLEPDLTNRVKKWVHDRNYSINTLFTSLFLIYHHKFYEQQDLLIGTPVSNHTMKFKQVFGMMTSTMPLRLHIDNEAISSTAFIEKVDRQLQKCYKYQKYPYDLLANALELKKNDIEQLLPFSVNYYHFQLNKDIDGIRTIPQEIYSGSQIYALQLVISDWHPERGIQLDYDFKVENYNEAEIALLHESIHTLLEQVLETPDQKLAELKLLNKQREDELLYNWNSRVREYPKDRTVIQLFEEQVQRTPFRIAVECDGTVLTYEQLNQRANRMASYLRKRGITREKLAAILAVHSIETVTAMLAVLKAGGAYVPIDPVYPVERVQHMLDTSSVAILLTDRDVNAEIAYDGPIVRLDNSDLFESETDRDMASVNVASDLAYVIFTSGSTGKPKGVMIEHQGLTNYIWWAKQVYTDTESIEVFPLYSSLAFDLTVTSIFTPLVAGHKMIVYREDEHEFVLYRIMKDNLCTIVKLTPSHLGLLRGMPFKQSSVKTFIVGGEDLNVALCQQIHYQFNSNIRIFNEYGPTETVVGCMIHEFSPDKDTDASVPIGVPADNVQIYVLDRKMYPVAIGASGEMYISGDGVARGYMNRMDLTEERFLLNPFIPGQRMYRTGDLARLSADGKVHYLGRTDHQVKIRGYRIELAEIEKQLFQHSVVNDAVVIDLESEDGRKWLCGYIELRDEDSLVMGNSEKTAALDSELRSCLSLELPQYMIPQQFVYVTEIPLTLNGKVDRSRLPKPIVIGGEKMLDAQTLQERDLLSVVQDVLGSCEIGMGHNFYHVGGDSIKAIQISAKLAELGYRLKVKDMLSIPLFMDMMHRMELVTVSRLSEQRPCTGTVLPLPITSWFFAQAMEEPHYYNQSFLLHLKYPVKAEQLRMWLKLLITHHDSLRLNVNHQMELFYNEKHLEQDLVDTLHVADLSHLSQQQKVAAIEEISVDLKSTFDLQHDLLIRGCLFELGNDQQRLLLTAHHLIIDGVSWRILLEDLKRLFEQYSAGHDPKLGPKTSSYQQWAEGMNLIHTELHHSEYGNPDEWSEHLYPSVQIPLDIEEEVTPYDVKDTFRIELSENDTKLLCTDANKPYQTRVLELLLCGLTRSLTQWTGTDEVVIMLEGHGREEIIEGIDLTETVGWFTTMYPVRFLRTEEGLASQIKSCKEQLRSIPHNGFYYGIHRYMPPVTFSLAEERQLVRFNFLGELDRALRTSYFDIAAESHGPDVGRNNSLTCLIDINAYITGGNLQIEITYTTGQLRQDTISYFANNLKMYLLNIIEHCIRTDQIEFTPSDFESVRISQEDLDSLFE